MLLEMAQGDAYGLSFEYAKADFVAANNVVTHYVTHHHFPIIPGRYSDDTQRAIANAEVILDDLISREELAQAYVDVFKRDQRDGYARGYYGFLCSVADGAEFLAKISPFSDKSGGAMGALPFGIYPNIEDVIAHSTLQASITHNTTDGINAGVAASLMSHYFLYDLGAKAHLGEFVEAHVPGSWAQPWQGAVGEKGWMSVRAALTAIIQGGDMTDILRRSVGFTGDVDTVAALALGAAAHSKEVEQNQPAFLERDLENGPFGRDFLVALNDQLMSKMHSLRASSSSSSSLSLSCSNN